MNFLNLNAMSAFVLATRNSTTAQFPNAAAL